MYIIRILKPHPAGTASKCQGLAKPTLDSQTIVRCLFCIVILTRILIIMALIGPFCNSSFRGWLNKQNKTNTKVLFFMNPSSSMARLDIYVKYYIILIHTLFVSMLKKRS